MSIKRMAGTTLIELIVAIVIVSTALAGLVAAYNRANTASADPLITQQQLAIAESMMEEVMQKPFVVAQQNQTGRLFFNDVRDYNNYGPAAVSNVNGDAVPGLGRYTVQVRVDQPAITGVAPADALRIEVIVRAAGAENLRLVGWRTRP